MSELPVRPRLAPGVWARRHLVDGDEQILLKGPGFDGVMQIGTAAWRALTFADGTRDHEGLRLACERDGVHWTEDEMTELLSDLDEVGFLQHGVAPEEERIAPDDEQTRRPLEPLAGFKLRCDGDGSCCRFYDSIAFKPDEAQRAQLITLRRAPRDLFTPFLGAQLDRGNWAAMFVDGRCAFLQSDRRCELQCKNGVASKPVGCRTYPATFTDDGVVIRVSVTPECGCVFASAGRDDGDPLVAAGVTTLSDAGVSVAVTTLPAEISLSSQRTASRAELRAWSAWLGEHLATGDDDAAALMWSLGAAVERHGLVMEIPKAHLSDADRWVGWLAAAAEGVADDDASWRAEHDLRRHTTRWIADALQEGAAIGSGPSEEERCYLLTLNHAYRLATDGRHLADGLRDRAVRILASRAMAARRPTHADPSHRFPLALLEAAMRDGKLSHYLPV